MLYGHGRSPSNEVRGFCQTCRMTEEAEALRRCALGSFLRHWRAAQDLSVEAMAERAGLGHMTWRRLEDGHAVRAQTYITVETVTGLPAGLVSRALRDDAALIEVAQQLGIEVSTDQSPEAFLRSFALPTAWAQQLASQTAEPEEDLPAVGALVAKLSARRDRTPTEETALRALIAWLAELTR